jgi:hypothetical protein
MDDIVITVVAWSMAISMCIGVIGGWLVFVVAWLNDVLATRPRTLPHWIRNRQNKSDQSMIRTTKSYG